MRFGEQTFSYTRGFQSVLYALHTLYLMYNFCLDVKTHFGLSDSHKYPTYQVEISTEQAMRKPNRWSMLRHKMHGTAHESELSEVKRHTLIVLPAFLRIHAIAA